MNDATLILIKDLTRPLVTKADRARGAALEAAVSALQAQIDHFKPLVLNDAIDVACETYLANPTLENLCAYGETIERRTTRQNVVPKITVLVNKVEQRLHLEEVVPWQLALLDRVIPAARDYSQKLITAEVARGRALIGSSFESNDVINAAKEIVPYLEGLRNSVQTNAYTPRALFSEIRAEWDDATGVEAQASKR